MFRKILIVLSVVAMAVIFVLPVFAQEGEPTAPPTDLMGVLTTLVTPLLIQFLALPGVAGISAAVVNILKASGVAKDGDAPNVGLLISALLFAGFVVITLMVPGFDIKVADNVLGTVAKVLVSATELFLVVGGARWMHTNALKGITLLGLGTSFSLKK